jgi:hypothetical protein
VSIERGASGSSKESRRQNKQRAKKQQLNWLASLLGLEMNGA